MAPCLRCGVTSFVVALARAVDRCPPAPRLLGDVLHRMTGELEDVLGTAVGPLDALGRQLRRLSAEELVATTTSAWQRARRGWSHRDVWHVGLHLQRVTGEMLLHLAEVSWSWSDRLADSPEQWQEVLRHHGAVLLQGDPETPDDVAAVRASMRWVADHHLDLRD